MIITIIAALDDQGGIGLKNQIPWHLPGDLRRFKNLTMGHHLIMGRKTYQSIGKPLPGRRLIVLSRNTEFRLDGIQVVSSFEDGLKLASDEGESEIFVIGGGEIYGLALPKADRMYLSRLHTAHQADVFFPPYDPDEWVLICEQTIPASQSNPIEYTFTHLVRKALP